MNVQEDTENTIYYHQLDKENEKIPYWQEDQHKAFLKEKF